MTVCMACQKAKATIRMQTTIVNTVTSAQLATGNSMYCKSCVRAMVTASIEQNVAADPTMIAAAKQEVENLLA